MKRDKIWRDRADRLRDLALLATAHGLLCALKPEQAHALMMRVGAWLPTLTTPEDARCIARSMGRHGSCLGRSIAIAARAPAADVVIGVELRSEDSLFAHAWVEMNGVPIDPSDVAGNVIARLRGPASTTPESLPSSPPRARFLPLFHRR
jgi:hypothetical protein